MEKEQNAFNCVVNDVVERAVSFTQWYQGQMETVEKMQNIVNQHTRR